MLFLTSSLWCFGSTARGFCQALSVIGSTRLIQITSATFGALLVPFHTVTILPIEASNSPNGGWTGGSQRPVARPIRPTRKRHAERETGRQTRAREREKQKERKTDEVMRITHVFLVFDRSTAVAMSGCFCVRSTRRITIIVDDTDENEST